MHCEPPQIAHIAETVITSKHPKNSLGRSKKILRISPTDGNVISTGEMGIIMSRVRTLV